MDRAAFERQWAELSHAYEIGQDNVNCIACDRCIHCIGCTFCVDSEHLRLSNYCYSCRDCIGCVRCERCTQCVDCKHCVDSKSCHRSAYLIRSLSCVDCTYCFGCVGLIGKDFYILNQPYERSNYFQIASRLIRELSIKGL